MSTLATIRADVRNDLHDNDASDERWADAILNRHIERALQEYSHVSPIEQKSTLTTSSDSREVDVSTLTPRVRIIAAEYPTGEYPPAFVPFTLWGDTITLDLAGAPSGTPNVIVLWHKEHSINGSVTFPSNHDHIIATGAAGYAALEWSSFATNRVNTGGDNVWGMYADFANTRLAAFRDMLRQLPAANSLRTARLYAPVDARLRSQTTDPGPV